MTDAVPDRPDRAAISTPRVHEALWRIRYAQELADSPLLGTAAVAAALARSGLPDTPADRAFALSRLLADLLTEALGEARGIAGPGSGPGALDVGPEALAADFAAGDATREAFSAVYHRFVATEAVPVGVLAERAGVSRRSFERRLGRGSRLLAERLRAAEESAMRSGGAPSSVGSRSPSAGALVDDPADAWRARARRWREALATGHGLSDADRAAVAPWLHRAPTDAREYRLARVAQATSPRALIDARFVPLRLAGDVSGGASPMPAREPFGSLDAFLERAAATAVVVLGPPGSGKSTLLRRYELTAAVDGLAGEPAPITLLASLGMFQAADDDAPASPAAWLAAAWARRAPGLPPLDALLEEGGVVLLLDGLDELPRAGRALGDSAVRPWQDWVQALAETATRSGLPNRAVFTCRALDYTLPLSRPSVPVPQAWVEPLAGEAVPQLVRAYAGGDPDRVDSVLARLGASSEAERVVLRLPFYLRLFAEQPPGEGALAGPTALLADGVRRALVREIERGHPALASGPLLTDHDRRRLIGTAATVPARDLALEGPLLDRLSALGAALHEQAGARSDGDRGRAGRAEVRTLLGEADAPAILAAAEALAILDADVERDEVRFVHPLLQEYFAARWVGRDPADLAQRVAALWRADAVRPSLEETLDGLGATEALPPLPSTGWETVAELAVALSESPAEWVARLEGVNLPLAGRCAALPGVRPRLPDALVEGLARALVERSGDERADLRARIAAARALGELGDPRLALGQGPDGAYRLGPLVDLPAATIALGEPARRLGDAASRVESHAPEHPVAVGAFALAAFPVTNAEWAHFMAAGAYDDPRWWPGDAATRWQRGEGTAHAVRENVRLWWHRFRERPGLLDEVRAAGQIDDAQHAEWLERLALDVAGLEGYLEGRFPAGRKTAPRHWDDPALNHPAQPVVGICWFEARAYALWLAAQSERRFRLPTEAEWERAARGEAGRDYPFEGPLDPARCNVRASHIRRPTPIGVYPGGASPEGLHDLTGNVLEWTSSEVRAYPYDAGDGREDPGGGPGVARVLRGGSWINAFLEVRAAVRYPYLPDTRDAVDGLRLACGPF